MKSYAAAFLRGLAGLMFLAALAPARAETVFLARGDDSFGHGWLFLDSAGQCRVATPRHVVEGADGALVPPDLIDSYGRTLPTHSPIAAVNAALDLAFLNVGGTLAKNGCSRDRLRATPLQTILDSLKQAQLDVSTRVERQSINVAIRAVVRDDSGGSIIAVSSVDPSVQFQKGMSGGTIMHNGRPLAMLLEVDSEEGIGVALRYDIIAAELQKLASVALEQGAETLQSASELVLVSGQVAERDGGLSNFLAGKSALKLHPSDGRIVFMLETGRHSVVHGIKLKAKGQGNEAHLIVETEKDHGGFHPGVRCVLREDLSCLMAPRRADRLRLTLTGADDETYVIENLELMTGGA